MSKKEKQTIADQAIDSQTNPIIVAKVAADKEAELDRMILEIVQEQNRKFKANMAEG